MRITLISALLNLLISPAWSSDLSYIKVSLLEDQSVQRQLATTGLTYSRKLNAFKYRNKECSLLLDYPENSYSPHQVLLTLLPRFHQVSRLQLDKNGEPKDIHVGDLVAKFLVVETMAGCSALITFSAVSEINLQKGHISSLDIVSYQVSAGTCDCALEWMTRVLPTCQPILRQAE